MLRKNFLSFFFPLFITNLAFAQLQIGYHYKIPVGTKLVYTYSDTTRDADMKIIQIDVHTYLHASPLPTVTTDKSNPAVTVVTHYHPGLELCSALKGAITQKDGDASGKLYIDFWGITKDPAKCMDAKFNNRSKRLGQFHYQLPMKLTLADITQTKKFNYATTEVGIVAIPFMVCFGYKKDTIHVPNDASANASLAGYVGRKWGTTKFYADKEKTINKVAVSVAGFLGPTVITVSNENAFPTKDSIITRALKMKANELGLSTGGAFTFSTHNFNVGFFLGLDFPLTGNGDRWYYAKRPWIGIGWV